MDPKSAAAKAVSVIGYGYNLCRDVKLSSCKPGPGETRLIEIDPTRNRDLVVPGGVVIADVSASIKCDKGERARFSSDVLSFNQMSEQFNKSMSLSGKIPSGQFNFEFGFNGCWKTDAGPTKSLASDGWFITLYNIELERSNITLSKHFKQEVPTSWDPAALAEFIEKYGTHIVVGVKMGGKDVVHIKQLQNSPLPPAEVQKLLKELADKRFSENANKSSNSENSPEFSGRRKEEHSMPLNHPFLFTSSARPSVVTRYIKDDIVSIHVRKGGVDTGQSHNDWLSTVSQSPNVISMSFVPITSLLNGVPGIGFLHHAVNLYLRYKPPIEELHQFFEFQLPRQWAPAYGDFPLTLKHRNHSSPSLQFTLMGPKLYVNTTKVDSRRRPVTGLRLYLEGKKSNHLAIHLQHLSTLPKNLQISDDQIPCDNSTRAPAEKAYFEPVNWRLFSHVCTAPVENPVCHIDDETASIMTKAWFEVRVVGIKKVLFLRLGFSTIASARIRRSEWEGPGNSSRKSGFLSTLMISTRFSTAGLYPPEIPQAKVEVNSAVFPGGPPLPSRALRMASLINTKEMVRGPEDTPGYWVVTGAKLCVDGGRISIKVKYSLLTIITEEMVRGPEDTPGYLGEVFFF